jgi:hypothetical protein
MQLLYGRADPGPEFASLSMLLRSDVAADGSTCHMGEPLVLPSPLSTMTQASCVQALAELHLYISSVLRGASSGSSSGSGGGKSTNGKDPQQPQHPSSSNHRLLLEDDERRLTSGTAATTTQIFRPRGCHGVALLYRLIRDRKHVSPLVPLIVNHSGGGMAATPTSGAPSASSNNNNKPATTTAATNASLVALMEREVTGVVLCVGITGMSLTHSVVSQRMGDCMDILFKRGVAATAGGGGANDAGSAAPAQSSSPLDLPAARSLLATMLLTDDEDRVTNSMASAAQRTLVTQEEEGG